MISSASSTPTGGIYASPSVSRQYRTAQRLLDPTLSHTPQRRVQPQIQEHANAPALTPPAARNNGPSSDLLQYQATWSLFDQSITSCHTPQRRVLPQTAQEGSGRANPPSSVSFQYQPTWSYVGQPTPCRAPQQHVNSTRTRRSPRSPGVTGRLERNRWSPYRRLTPSNPPATRDIVIVQEDPSNGRTPIQHRRDHERVARRLVFVQETPDKI